MKRRVPAALHQELTEYAALLRALRVRDTLDVTKHITKPSPFALGSHELDANEDEEKSSSDDASQPFPSVFDSTLRTPTPGPSDLSHPANAQAATPSATAKGKQRATPVRKQKRRDHWTRWPLLLPDVLKPEWSLEDEIAVIASQVMKLRPPIRFPVSPVGEDDDDEVFDDDDEDRPIRVRDVASESDDPDHPFYVPYLSSVIAHFLSVILAALALQTPARPASMQNRIEPLGWRTVIDAVVMCDVPEFSNPKVVEKVIKRMEAIYGPSILPVDGPKATSFRAVERIKTKEIIAANFAQMIEKHVNDLFEPPHIPSPSPSPSPTPPTVKLNKRARSEENDFVPRKRWSAKEKGTGRGRGKRPKRPLETAPEPSDNNAGSLTENEQSVRRSKRARTTANYIQIPPDDIE